MDRELEAAIESAGRDAVFDLARESGWGPGSVPPKWVWWKLVADVENAKGKRQLAGLGHAPLTT